jgi:hypothetical protein
MDKFADESLQGSLLACLLVGYGLQGRVFFFFFFFPSQFCDLAEVAIIHKNI